MTRRVSLELHRAPGGPPDLVLWANDAIPPFWFALFTDEAVAHWADAVHAAWDDSDAPVGDLSLAAPWPVAASCLYAAAARAPERLPAWADAFRRWMAALDRAARRGPVVRVTLHLAGLADRHPTAEAFVAEITAGIALWHGPSALVHPDPLPVQLAGWSDDPALRPFSDVPAPRRRPGSGMWLFLVLVPAGVVATVWLSQSAWAGVAAFIILLAAALTLTAARTRRTDLR